MYSMKFTWFSFYSTPGQQRHLAASFYMHKLVSRSITLSYFHRASVDYGTWYIFRFWFPKCISAKCSRIMHLLHLCEFISFECIVFWFPWNMFDHHYHHHHHHHHYQSFSPGCHWLCSGELEACAPFTETSSPERVNIQPHWWSLHWLNHDGPDDDDDEIWWWWRRLWRWWW